MYNGLYCKTSQANLPLVEKWVVKANLFYSKASIVNAFLRIGFSIIVSQAKRCTDWALELTTHHATRSHTKSQSFFILSQKLLANYPTPLCMCTRNIICDDSERKLHIQQDINQSRRWCTYTYCLLYGRHRVISLYFTFYNSPCRLPITKLLLNK